MYIFTYLFFEESFSKKKQNKINNLLIYTNIYFHINFLLLSQGNIYKVEMLNQKNHGKITFFFFSSLLYFCSA